MTQKKCIWIIEDDFEIQKLMELVLSTKYNLVFFNTFKAIKDSSLSLNHSSNKPDMFLLDLNLPDGTGFDVIKFLKNENLIQEKNPVVFLTANDSISSKLLGFELGALDYICKPIDPLELKARIDVIFKIYSMINQKQTDEILYIENLEINLIEQNIYSNKNGERVSLGLTYSEYKLLVYFIKKPNILFNREQLLDVLRGDNINTVDRSVDVVIYRLRRKLGEVGKYIKSVYGGGYKFDFNPTQNTSVAKSPLLAEKTA